MQCRFAHLHVLLPGALMLYRFNALYKTSAVPNYERKRKCSDGQDRTCKNVEDTDRNQLNRNASCSSNKETAVNRFRGCRLDGWVNLLVRSLWFLDCGMSGVGKQTSLFRSCIASTALRSIGHIHQFPPLREGRRMPWPPCCGRVTFQFPPLREGRPLSMVTLFAYLAFQFTPLREGRQQ